MSEYIELKDLVVYQKAVELADIGWSEYERWEYYIRKTVGDQFIRAADSIAANIAEGYGRFYYLDKIRFYYNARGSLYELFYWIEQLHKRKCISQETNSRLMQLHTEISYKLHKLISGNYASKYQSPQNRSIQPK